MSSEQQLPRHVAIVMDGNGRWAKKRFLPRVAGHRAGLESVRRIVQYAATKGIRVLTLFAFSSENWKRPIQEVNHLLDLFASALHEEAKRLHKENIQVCFIGDSQPFPPGLQKGMQEIMSMTAENTGLKLVIAVNYGGRWDIMQAIQQIRQAPAFSDPAVEIDEATFERYLSLSELPDPDLFIRTSGEQRISNFLLWQLAYTELYFTETLWPDFNEAAFEQALVFFMSRQRRFGATSEQLETHPSA